MDIKKTTKTEIKESLMLQLKNKNADVSHFEDIVNDYMALWDIKNKLVKNIKKRGVMYEDYSSVGIKMMKNNPSVKELTGVNRQMLIILRELGLSTDMVKSHVVDDNPDNL